MQVGAFKCPLLDSHDWLRGKRQWLVCEFRLRICNNYGASFNAYHDRRGPSHCGVHSNVDAVGFAHSVEKDRNCSSLKRCLTSVFVASFCTKLPMKLSFSARDMRMQRSGISYVTSLNYASHIYLHKIPEAKKLVKHPNCVLTKTMKSITDKSFGGYGKCLQLWIKKFAAKNCTNLCYAACDSFVIFASGINGEWVWGSKRSVSMHCKIRPKWELAYLLNPGAV